MRGTTGVTVDVRAKAGLACAGLGLFFCLCGPALSAATGWDPSARVGVGFSRDLQPSKETLKGIEVALDLYKAPDCYWIADAQADSKASLDEAWARAEALRVSLVERDVPFERVVAWAHLDPAQPKSSTELRVHCSPPGSLPLTFAKASSDLSGETVIWLDVLSASVPERDRTFVVRGFAAPSEQANPLKLALARALIVRRAMIERGFPGRLIQVEADTKDTGKDPANAEIVLH